VLNKQNVSWLGEAPIYPRAPGIYRRPGWKLGQVNGGNGHWRYQLPWGATQIEMRWLRLLSEQEVCRGPDRWREAKISLCQSGVKRFFRQPSGTQTRSVLFSSSLHALYFLSTNKFLLEKLQNYPPLPVCVSLFFFVLKSVFLSLLLFCPTRLRVFRKEKLRPDLDL
jgi:hypothetical protein